MTPMKSPKTRIPVGVRRALAATAITAVAMAGWHLNTSTQPGIGAIGLVPGATAEPTGPPSPGGMTDGGGSQFQPPQMPGQPPEYQGGNQPPLNQDNGISIHNSGAPQAGQQPGQQGGQQSQEGWQTPQHGSQPPDYQTATPYTEGPGQANPDYQAPQQNSPQQGSQQQPQQQQQPQNKQDDTTQQLDQQKQQKCMNAAVELDYVSLASGGGGSLDMLPEDPLTPLVPCNGACSQLSQPGGRHTIQKGDPPPKADDPKAQKQIDQLIQDAKHCDFEGIAGDVLEIQGSGAIFIGGVLTFPAGVVGIAAGGYGIMDGLLKIAECSRSAHPGITRIPGK